MGVHIEGGGKPSLLLTGDIETRLDVPARGIAEGFSLAFSDGTLIHGTFLDGAFTCRFALAVEGAAQVRIARHEDGDRVDLASNFEWITLACGQETLQPEAADADENVLQLTLDFVVEERV
ncbi:hypothetical protein [Novosphingobium profundi]|uniref:hypothetical protein n=1 Tax=Novosphingobium profundi TaxID=1774954 RepID=UPI001CFC9BB0|nr:hypothetical protein [Novosphingobium profundi]